MKKSFAVMSSISFALKEKYQQNIIFRYVILGLLMIFVVLLPFPLNNYQRHIINMTGIFIILSLSLDVALGWTGLIHLAVAAFYGIGAYATGLFMLRVLPNTYFAYWLSLPLIVVLTGLVGCLVALPGLKLRGLFFAIATIAFGELVFSILNNWVDLTGGSYGLSGIPKPQIMSFVFDNPIKFYYLIYFFVIMVCILLFRFMKGPTGRVWMAVREDEIAASNIRINVKKAKVEAFVTSAILSGVAGWLFAPYVSYLSPSNFTSDESILVLTMVIIGGRSTLIGPIIGSILLFFSSEILRPITRYRFLVYGIILCVIIVLRPQGLVGRLKK